MREPSQMFVMSGWVLTKPSITPSDDHNRDIYVCIYIHYNTLRWRINWL